MEVQTIKNDKNNSNIAAQHFIPFSTKMTLKRLYNITEIQVTAHLVKKLSK